MVVSKDWIPASRDEQLVMAKNWEPILSAKETEWNLPGAVITELVVLATAKHEATRTPVATVSRSRIRGRRVPGIRSSARLFRKETNLFRSVPTKNG
jgi:hypothetical protein